MKLLQKTLIVMLALASAMEAETPANNAGSKYFDQALRNISRGATADAAAAVDKGWAAVLAAGPNAAGFLDGVYQASAIIGSLGQPLRAEAVYSDAEMLCVVPNLQPVRLRLQYMHADHLIGTSEYVKAESILRNSLAIENRAPQKSSLYVATLQSLAFLREQENDLGGAEMF
jgi:hypothetical protein